MSVPSVSARRQSLLQPTPTPLVVVMGLGFVGLAMATVVAQAKNASGEVAYRVIGLDVPEQQSRLDQINQGHLPFATEDQSFSPALQTAVCQQQNLLALSDPSVLAHADIIVLDINLDIHKLPGQTPPYQLMDGPFRKALTTLGQFMRPETLLLVETTVPPGFCQHIIAPTLQAAFTQRGLTDAPLIAHAYERVMPGRDYLRSIREYFRTFSGLSPEAAERAQHFLNNIVDTHKAPLRQESHPNASELAKIMENAYRSVNIALLHEWCLLAEKMGVNLFSVVEGIRVRKTHQNIMNPGFGVGGYCLTKDALLAQWSADHLFATEHGLPLSLQAIAINDKMPLHTVARIQAERSLSNAKIALLGVSYREDVGDTRYSPSETFCHAVLAAGAQVQVHDPYLNAWPELPHIPWLPNLEALSEADIVVLATRHQQYRNHDWRTYARTGQLWVDANNLLDDQAIIGLLQQGCDVIGIGKGHILTLKETLI